MGERIKAQKGLQASCNCLKPGRNDQGIIETLKNNQKLKNRYEKYQQTPKWLAVCGIRDTRTLCAISTHTGSTTQSRKPRETLVGNEFCSSAACSTLLTGHKMTMRYSWIKCWKHNKKSWLLQYLKSNRKPFLLGNSLITTGQILLSDRILWVSVDMQSSKDENFSKIINWATQMLVIIMKYKATNIAKHCIFFKYKLWKIPYPNLAASYLCIVTTESSTVILNLL